MGNQNNYAYGLEWAESLIASFTNDPFAQEIMAHLGLTSDDLRIYYLSQPFYTRVQAKFNEQQGELENHDPVARVLMAAKAVKEEALRATLQ